MALADAGVAGQWRGGPAAPGTAPGNSDRPAVAAAALAGGGCCAWPLPADATCAAVARGVFREVAAALALPEELASDGLLMTSELAANTLHAHGQHRVRRRRGLAHRGRPRAVDLPAPGGGTVGTGRQGLRLAQWLEGRPGAGARRCRSRRGERARAQVVAGLSAGRWGQHLTRSRFGGWKVPGKAVWFAQPVPGGVVPEPLRRTRLAPGRAARALEEMLVERGLGGGLLRAQEPSAGMSVLSVRCGLTVWCREQRDLVAVPGRPSVRAGAHRPGRDRRADRLRLRRDGPRHRAPG